MQSVSSTIHYQRTLSRLSLLRSKILMPGLLDILPHLDQRGPRRRQRVLPTTMSLQLSLLKRLLKRLATTKLAGSQL